MSIKVHIEVEDAEGLAGFNVMEHSDDEDAVDAATLASLIGTAQRKANALLSPTSTCTTDDDSAKGTKVGTAYIEVRPHFSGFDGEEFDKAVRRVIDAQGAYVCNRRAFRP
jgi:hypothetical protein